MSFYPYQSYLQQQAPMQQTFVPQPNVPTSSLSGRVVNDFNEITINDVPMSGQYAYFPKADMSEIQVRRWKPDGTIESRLLQLCRTIPSQVDNRVDDLPTDDKNGSYTLLSEKIDKVIEMLSPVQKVRTKREVTPDE